MAVGQAAEDLRLRPLAHSTARSRRSGLSPEALQGYLFLLPAMLLLLLFHLLPVFYALFLSLFDARVFKDMWHPGPFVAAGNYSRLLTSGDFAQSLTNTLWFAAFTVPVGLCLAVLFAQLLNAKIWGRTG